MRGLATHVATVQDGGLSVVFVIEFANDGRTCRVVDEQGRKLLAVAVRGDASLERRDRIAQIAGQLLGECQQAAVVVAPFKDGDSS